MKEIFKGVHLKDMKPVPIYINKFADNRRKLNMARKLQFLAMVEVNDPFFELLGYIRDENSLGQK